MITLHMEFPAHSLKRNVSIKALVPVDSSLDWKNTVVDSSIRFKTLYLLHGFGGDCSDWLLNTRLYKYATEHNIAVIMPSGENSFYLDNANSEKDYSGYVTKELIEITRALFPLSDKREDTLIGGLSMGGYGAICNGLKHPEIFGSIIAMSAALITDKVAGMKEDYEDFMAGYKYYEYTFGKTDKIQGSMEDPKYLVECMIKSQKPIPHIYLACGTEDFLLDANRSFVECLKVNNVVFTYEEEQGNHDWDFWEIHIKRALDWYKRICEGEK